MKAFDIFQANIKHKHTDVLNNWEAFLRDITKGNTGIAAKSCERFLISLKVLNELIRADGTPMWLNEMISYATPLSQIKTFSEDNNRTAYFKRLLENEAQMAAFSYEATVTNDVQPILNLEAIIAKYHSQSTLNNLYDRAIEHINQALASGQVDSKRVSEDLTRVLASIKNAKTSAFITQRLEVSNLRDYLKAIAKASLKRLPVVGEVLQVIEEANQELQASNNQIMTEVEKIRGEQTELMRRFIESQPVVIENQTEVIEADFHQFENETTPQ